MPVTLEYFQTLIKRLKTDKEFLSVFDGAIKNFNIQFNVVLLNMLEEIILDTRRQCNLSPKTEIAEEAKSLLTAMENMAYLTEDD